MMATKPTKFPHKSAREKNVTIMAAGIGLFGVVLAALINFWSNFLPKDLFQTDTPKLMTRIRAPESMDYELIHGDNSLIIRARDSTLAINPTDHPVRLNVDLTNKSRNSISVNAIRMQLITSEKASDRPALSLLSIKFKSTTTPQQRDYLTKKYSLVFHDSTGPFLRYSTPDHGSDVVNLINAKHDLVDIAFIEAYGETHRVWEKTTDTDITTEPEKFQYVHQVGHLVKANESLTIPISIAFHSPKITAGELDLLVNGSQHVSIGKLWLNFLK
jgi:hypothetical protein